MSNRTVDRDAVQDGLSLVDRVHAAVRQSILSGEYPPGSRLLATTIAGANGVSSIPVREALRRLETERLVVVERNRGATVAQVSVGDMHDVFETRSVIECDALRRAFPHLTEAVFETASRELEEMTRLLDRGSSREAYEHHRAFHFALYEPAASPWSMHVIRLLWVGAERYLRLAAELEESPREFAAEHEDILATVRDGTVEAAVERLRKHLADTALALGRAFASGTTPHLAPR